METSRHRRGVKVPIVLRVWVHQNDIPRQPAGLVCVSDSPCTRLRYGVRTHRILSLIASWNNALKRLEIYSETSNRTDFHRS